MFNFEDINTSEYRRHTQFVDINTNKPKRLSELDKNNFPYFFIDKPLPKQIFFKEQLISPDECAYLSWLAETNDKWTKISNSFWDDRTSDLFLDVSKHKYQSEYTIRIILGVHQKMKEFVEKSFGIECFADTMVMARWPINSFQMPHVDEILSKSRVARSVLYLNDDYEGGETYYPYYDAKHSPKLGSIFAHGADGSHLHGVSKVLDKPRYTISCTWSTKKEHSTYDEQIVRMKSYLETIGQVETSIHKAC